MDTLELLEPRAVATETAEPEVAFGQTWDAGVRDRGRCPITVPRLTGICVR